jgi:hypothetical protein
VIRLAVSCDICGAEKKQANHWFVAYEHAGELRISGWKSRHCKRAGSRHLCGQACLHKLVDEFMAQTIAEDREIAAAERASPQPQILPAAARHGELDESGSSARLVPAAAPVGDARPMPIRPESVPLDAPLAGAQKYASHQWRSSAWERERKRESFGR